VPQAFWFARQEPRSRPFGITSSLLVSQSRFCALNAAGKWGLFFDIDQELDVSAVGALLEALEQFLVRTPATLNSEGRMVVMSYHSLEDRRVKYFFREQAAAGVLQIVTKKAVQATDDEIHRNHRARSVKLRAAEKMAGVQ